MRTVWITGAAGFIGSMLSAQAVEQGQRCFGLDLRPSAEPSIEPGHFVTGSVSDASLASLLSLSGPPQAVFHLAGGSAVGPSFADPAADFAATVGSTSSLLDFLRRHAPLATVVLASSAAIYGVDHAGAISETTTPNPFSPYGAHKLIMESLADSYTRFFDLDIRVARLFSVYGAGLRKQLLWDLCVKLAQGDKVVLGGTGQEQRDFIHGKDVARALDALSRCVTGWSPAIVNIGSGQPSSIRSVAETVAAAWRAEAGRQISIEFNGDSRPGDPASLFAATSRMQEAIGFSPQISLEQGLAGYVSWFLAEHGSSR